MIIFFDPSFKIFFLITDMVDCPSSNEILKTLTDVKKGRTNTTGYATKEFWDLRNQIGRDKLQQECHVTLKKDYTNDKWKVSVLTHPKEKPEITIPDHPIQPGDCVRIMKAYRGASAIIYPFALVTNVNDDQSLTILADRWLRYADDENSFESSHIVYPIFAKDQKTILTSPIPERLVTALTTIKREQNVPSGQRTYFPSRVTLGYNPQSLIGACYNVSPNTSDIFKFKPYTPEQSEKSLLGDWD